MLEVFGKFQVQTHIMRVRMSSEGKRIQRTAHLVGVLFLLGSLPGCGMGRTGMQIDSDSRSPFLSWQVPISTTAGEANIQTAAGVQSRPAIEQLKLEQATAPKSTNALTGWFQKLRPPMAIPLPRTDIDDDG